MSELRYTCPTSIAQATALLEEAGGRAAILAGGTDLLIALRTGAARPSCVVDIKRIPGIAAISWTDAGDLVLGAAVRVQQVADDPRIRATFAALAEGAAAIGSLQIRERATVAGNLANASPCMDTAPPLLVLGAQLRLSGPDGAREAALSDFFTGVRQTALRPAEMVTAVVVPAPASGLSSGFDKIQRVAGHDLAIVNAAAAWDPARREVRVAIGSCAITPVLVPALGGVAPGADPDEVGRRLGALALEHIRPIDDVRASAEYRSDMTAALCVRLARRLLGAPRRPS